MVLFFPFTFIIWLVVLPFDTKRRVIHWILTLAKPDPCQASANLESQN